MDNNAIRLAAQKEIQRRKALQEIEARKAAEPQLPEGDWRGNPAVAGAVGYAKMMPFAEKAAAGSLAVGKALVGGEGVEGVERRYDQERAKQKDVLSAIKKENPTANAVGNVAGVVANPLNYTMGLLPQAALHSASSTPFNPVTETGDYIADVGINTGVSYAGGKVLDKVGNTIIPSAAKDKARRIYSEFLGKEGVGKLRAASGEKLPSAVISDKSAKLAAALAKKGSVGEVEGIAQSGKAGLQDIRKNVVSPMYEKATAVPLPNTRQTINTPPPAGMLGMVKGSTKTIPSKLDDFLAGDRNIAKVFRQALNETKNQGKQDTMAVLKSARDLATSKKMGSASAESKAVRDKITQFMKENGADLTKADAMHSKYFGTFDKANPSPKTNLQTIQKALESSVGMEGKEAVGDIVTKAGVESIPAGVMSLSKGIIGQGTPEIIKKMAADKRGRAELVNLLRQVPKETIENLDQKRIGELLVNMLRGSGVQGMQAVSESSRYKGDKK